MGDRDTEPEIHRRTDTAERQGDTATYGALEEEGAGGLAPQGLAHPPPIN